MNIENLAAADFRFFRCFMDGNDEMYAKFIKNCPSELEGLVTIRAIVESFQTNVLSNCKFIALANSVVPEINNITICRNYFTTPYDKENYDRSQFRKTFAHRASDKDQVFQYSDCIIYSEDESLTNQFISWSVKENLIHKVSLIKSREYLKKFLNHDIDFIESVMDISKTGKDKDIPWKHLPCLPIYIEDEKVFTTFDLSFIADKDGQTYLNRYNKEFELVERVPYKKFKDLEETSNG